jgi:hypothetical protein
MSPAPMTSDPAATDVLTARTSSVRAQRPAYRPAGSAVLSAPN